MKDKTKKPRNRWLHVRLDESEYTQMMENKARSTEKKLSTYARKLLLSQPVTIIHRDGSMDALIAVLTKVRNDLNGVTNNYNQMVHKLHIADNHREIRAWISHYEKEKIQLFESIDMIKQLITSSAKKWLR